MVLEYIEGGPLDGPLPIASKMRLALQVACGIEAAHERGILHCDLKPANILVTKDVLPFANLCGNAEQEYFADSVSEDIITELSRFRSLFVIARNSSFTYRGRAVESRMPSVVTATQLSVILTKPFAL